MILSFTFTNRTILEEKGFMLGFLFLNNWVLGNVLNWRFFFQVDFFSVIFLNVPAGLFSKKMTCVRNVMVITYFDSINKFKGVKIEQSEGQTFVKPCNQFV